MVSAVAALTLVASAATPASAARKARKDAPPPSLVEAREALERCRVPDASTALREKVAKAHAFERDVLLARVAVARGDMASAVKRLEPMVRKRPKSWEARVLLGHALQAVGRKADAYPVLDALATAYNAGELQGPEALRWLAEALWRTGYFKNANTIFYDAATEAAGDDHAALRRRIKLAWAGLFERKYNLRDADGLYREILDEEPGHPAALLGMARLDLESDSDVPKARARLSKVLAAAPDCVPAHVLSARLDLEHERLGDAVATLEGEALKRAPGDRRALALLGAAHALADDDGAYTRAEARALAADPKFAAFYTTVSEHLSRLHRYAEALAMDDKALGLDPEHWRAHIQLGVGWSRLGDDAKAKRHLEQAYDGDPYDVRTFNLLDRFYDGPITQFSWVDVPERPLRVRVHRDEKAVLERHVPPLLTEAYDHLVAAYGFEPKPPLHVEIFPTPELFAVRSIGLAGLGAHGICFGHVVTSRSPNSGDFNWAEVLWHELSHVFHLQLSNSRVPRWFTEGLAVWEATEGRPAWRREQDAELAAYRERGQLRGLADFNLAFTQARSMEAIVVAYYHASLVAEFIATQEGWGRPKLKAMLVAWGEEKGTEAVVEGVLGVGVAEFDTRFFAWLDTRLAARSGHLDLALVDGPADEDEAVAARKEADARKADVDAQRAAAVGALRQGDAEAARGYADRALTLAPDDPVARLVRAELLLSEGGEAALEQAREDLEHVAERGHDSPAVRKRLAKVAEDQGDGDRALEELERAVTLDGDDAAAWYRLAARYRKAGRQADEARAQRRAAALDQHSLEPLTALLDSAEATGATLEDVRLWGEQGVHVAPFDVDHHVRFGMQLMRLGATREARFAGQSALAIDPDHPDARTLLGR